MSLISDRQPCTAKERQDHVDYLKNNSHVSRPVVLMEKNGWPLEKAKVKGVGNIGSLMTCFTNLGNAHCRSLYGTPLFLVAQAMEVLANPNYRHHADIADAMQKLHRYKYLFAGPFSEPKVTIVELAGTIIVDDGNKTAIAAFLYAVETSQPDFILPVFYLAPPAPSAAAAAAPSAPAP